MSEIVTLNEALLQRAKAEQCIQLNPNAALQQQIFAHEFTPTSPEFKLEYAGQGYVGQRAERLSDSAVRVYYCQEGDWGNVTFVNDSLADAPSFSAQPEPFTPAIWRTTIWAITSIFESGRPQGNVAAFQNIDVGIISYGKHQATLQSGSLNKVLEEYFHRSQSDTKVALEQTYADRIKLRDASLRHDLNLQALLLQASLEPAMSEAQDVVFDRDYYQPAVQKALEYHICTPLGLACLYDTAIQGGLASVLQAMTTSAGGPVGTGGMSEKAWLAAFLDEREAFLNGVADRDEAQGDHMSATMLRNSTFRVQELRRLLQADHLGLEGELVVRHLPVSGLTPG